VGYVIFTIETDRSVRTISNFVGFDVQTKSVNREFD